MFFFLFSVLSSSLYFFFFFNDTATTEIYTLSLHDALPIYPDGAGVEHRGRLRRPARPGLRRVLRDRRVYDRDARLAALRRQHELLARDRKSTRLNSSHSQISYAVFCLKKKKKKKQIK